MSTVQTGALWRIASTRMPTKWGMFHAIGFERDISDGARKVETALALVMGNLTDGVPLLRIHSQCFTGEDIGFAALRLSRSAGNGHAGYCQRRSRARDLRVSGRPRHWFDGEVGGL